MLTYPSFPFLVPPTNSVNVGKEGDFITTFLQHLEGFKSDNLIGDEKLKETFEEAAAELQQIVQTLQQWLGDPKLQISTDFAMTLNEQPGVQMGAVLARSEETDLLQQLQWKVEEIARLFKNHQSMFQKTREMDLPKEVFKLLNSIQEDLSILFEKLPALDRDQVLPLSLPHVEDRLKRIKELLTHITLQNPVSNEEPVTNVSIKEIGTREMNQLTKELPGLFLPRDSERVDVVLDSRAVKPMIKMEGILGDGIPATPNLIPFLMSQNHQSSAVPMAIIEQQVSTTELVDKLQPLLLKHASKQDGVTSLSIMLQPEDLGKMEVVLHSRKGQVFAQFIVENAMAKDVVEDQLSLLKQQMIQHGIQIERFEVTYPTSNQQAAMSFQQPKQQEFKQSQQRSRRNELYAEWEDTDPAVAPARSVGQSSIDYTV